MHEEKVSVVRANGDIQEAVTRAVDLAGRMRKYVQPGERILLKPNLVAPRPSSSGATTDLDVVGAAAKLVR